MNAQAELFAQLLILMACIGWRQVETLNRTAMKRRLTILKVIVAALTVDTMKSSSSIRARWVLELLKKGSNKFTFNKRFIKLLSCTMRCVLTSTLLYAFNGSIEPIG